jgi:hypothetical protein
MVVSIAGIHKCAKELLLEFTESTSHPQSPIPSSECWCAVFSKTQLIAKDIYMQRNRIFNTSCDP